MYPRICTPCSHTISHTLQAHTTPDIVFLLSSCLVWAKNEVVPAKPRLVVSSTYIEKTTGRGGGERDAKRRRIKDEGGGVVVGNVAAAVASLSDAQQQQQQQQQQHHATLQPQIQLRPQLVQPPPGQNGPARIILQPSLQWGVGSSTAAAAVSAAAAQNTAIHPGTIPPNSQSFQSFQRILMPNGQIISVPLTRSTLVAANTINTNLQQQQQHGELNSAVFAALARQNKIGAAAAATTTTTTTRMMASGGVGGEGATTITTTPATADAPVPPAKIFKNRDDASLPASPQK